MVERSVSFQKVRSLISESPVQSDNTYYEELKNVTPFYSPALVLRAQRSFKPVFLFEVKQFLSVQEFFDALVKSENKSVLTKFADHCLQLRYIEFTFEKFFWKEVVAAKNAVLGQKNDLFEELNRSSRGSATIENYVELFGKNHSFGKIYEAQWNAIQNAVMFSSSVYVRTLREKKRLAESQTIYTATSENPVMRALLHKELSQTTVEDWESSILPMLVNDPRFVMGTKHIKRFLETISSFSFPQLSDLGLWKKADPSVHEIMTESLQRQKLSMALIKPLAMNEFGKSLFPKADLVHSVIYPNEVGRLITYVQDFLDQRKPLDFYTGTQTQSTQYDVQKGDTYTFSQALVGIFEDATKNEQMTSIVDSESTTAIADLTLFSNETTLYFRTLSKLTVANRVETGMSFLQNQTEKESTVDNFIKEQQRAAFSEDAYLLKKLRSKNGTETAEVLKTLPETAAPIQGDIDAVNTTNSDEEESDSDEDTPKQSDMAILNGMHIDPIAVENEAAKNDRLLEEYYQQHPEERPSPLVVRKPPPPPPVDEEPASDDEAIPLFDNKESAYDDGLEDDAADDNNNDEENEEDKRRDDEYTPSEDGFGDDGTSDKAYEVSTDISNDENYSDESFESESESEEYYSDDFEKESDEDSTKDAFDETADEQKKDEGDEDESSIKSGVREDDSPVDSQDVDDQNGGEHEETNGFGEEDDEQDVPPPTPPPRTRKAPFAPTDLAKGKGKLKPSAMKKKEEDPTTPPPTTPPPGKKAAEKTTPPPEEESLSDNRVMRQAIAQQENLTVDNNDSWSSNDDDSSSEDAADDAAHDAREAAAKRQAEQARRNQSQEEAIRKADALANTREETAKRAEQERIKQETALKAKEERERERVAAAKRRQNIEKRLKNGKENAQVD